MLEKYTPSEYQKLYKDLPEKVQALFWDEDISSRIAKITERFKLRENDREKITKTVTHIFLGVLPPSNVSSAIEREIVLRGDDKERLANEIIRFLVFPTQHLLQELYKEEDFKKIGGTTISRQNLEGFSEDSYREPIV